MQAIADQAYGPSCKLSQTSLEAIENFLFALESNRPKVLDICNVRTWFMYTAACAEGADPDEKSGGIGGVLVDATGCEFEYFSCLLTFAGLVLFGLAEGHAIYDLEMLAVFAGLTIWQDHLQGCQLVCFVDNNGVRDSLISCRTRAVSARDILTATLRMGDTLNVGSWFARAPTEANVADNPSRGILESFGDLHECLLRMSRPLTGLEEKAG